MIKKGISAIASRIDSWSSTITGLGLLGRDKSLSSSITGNLPLTRDECLQLYIDSVIARRGVRSYPTEALAKGVTITLSDDQEGLRKKDLKQRLDAEEVLSLFHDAACWGRLFGGRAIFIGADDGMDPAAPLDLKRVSSVSSLTDIERELIRPQSVSRVGNRPITYLVNGLEVHASRLVMFEGVPIPKEVRDRFGGWTPSVLQPVVETLRSYDVGWQSIDTLFLHASQSVFKAHGLIEAIGAEGTESKFLERMKLLDMGRSTARALVLDAETEDFANIGVQWGGVGDILDRRIHRLCADFEAPAVILFGMSPGGLNATGEADLKWYRSSIESKRFSDLLPKLRRLVEVFVHAKDGPYGGNAPPDWSIEFPPLVQLSELEQADLRLKTAQTDAVYINANVVLPDEIAVSRFGPSGYSIDTQIDHEARAASAAIEIERMLSEAKNGDQQGDPATTGSQKEGSSNSTAP